MIRQMACAAVLAAATMLTGQSAIAQDQGARAGNSYLPSTHTKGCGGLMCDADDPRRAPGAAPPPPCQGLLCGMSPYGMGRPITAAEAKRMEEERARTAVAAPPAAEPAKPKRSARRKKAKATKTVATRTPDPTPPAPAASR